MNKSAHVHLLALNATVPAAVTPQRRLLIVAIAAIGGRRPTSAADVARAAARRHRSSRCPCVHQSRSRATKARGVETLPTPHCSGRTLVMIKPTLTQSSCQHEFPAFVQQACGHMGKSDAILAGRRDRRCWAPATISSRVGTHSCSRRNKYAHQQIKQKRGRYSRIPVTA